LKVECEINKHFANMTDHSPPNQLYTMWFLFCFKFYQYVDYYFRFKYLQHRGVGMFLYAL